MSSWTDWRDEFTAWLKADPKKALVLFTLGALVASIVALLV